MKSPNQISLLRSALVLGFTVMAGVPTYAQSPDMPMPMGKKTMQPAMADCCQEIKDHNQKIMAEMKAQDAALTAQVANMNSAPKDKKLDLLAAVVTRMVEQQTAMNAEKAKLNEKMMQHMMAHMQMGKESKPQSPMMKGMDEKPVDAYKSPQAEHK